MKILKYIFISMALFLLINNLIFMLVFSLSDDYQSLKKGHKDIIGKDHLIIGDSHSSYGIKNEHLSKFFYNFSFPGESIIANNYKIKRILENQKLKSIVIAISPYSISVERHGVSSFLHFFPEYSIHELNSISKLSNIEKMKILVGYFFPTIIEKNRMLLQRYFINHLVFGEQFSELKSFYFNDYNDLVHKDFSWITLNAKERQIKAFNRFENVYIAKDSDILVKYYEDLITYCNSNNIKIIGVFFPLTNELLDLFYENKILNQKFKIIKNLKFDSFYDYSNIFRNNQNYFLNADHLNLDGAIKFTKLISEKLKYEFR